ncbi:hypothetical protein J6590_010659 [Homalodisca vitripennis]|nr:hypothetical protein J6590_010659 [Homalodisca vitripennis]
MEYNMSLITTSSVARESPPTPLSVGLRLSILRHGRPTRSNTALPRHSRSHSIRTTPHRAMPLPWHSAPVRLIVNVSMIGSLPEHSDKAAVKVVDTVVSSQGKPPAPALRYQCRLKGNDRPTAFRQGAGGRVATSDLCLPAAVCHRRDQGGEWECLTRQRSSINPTD